MSSLLEEVTVELPDGEEERSESPSEGTGGSPGGETRGARAGSADAERDLAAPTDPSRQAAGVSQEIAAAGAADELAAAGAADELAAAESPAEVVAADSASERSSSLPVALEPVRRDEPRPGLWRRLVLRRESRRQREAEQRLAGQRSLERLGDLDDRLEELRRAMLSRFDRLEERWTEVWGVEEQLSRVAEMGEALESLRRHQKQARADLQSLRSAVRLLGFTTGLLAAAAAVALTMLAVRAGPF